MRYGIVSFLWHRYFPLAFSLLAFGFVFTGCGTSTTSSTNGSTPTGTTASGDEETVTNTNTATAAANQSTGETDEAAADTETSKNANTSAAAVVEIAIAAKQWEFTPAEVTVKKGDKVRLLVTSSDVDHGFVLEEFGVKETLKPGKTTTVEFTADKAGRFSFVCDVFCGSGHTGMKGTLIVE